MIKVLIADDEERIRSGLAKLVSVDEELEIVAQAEDGEEALEMADKFQPDIFLVDINMPFMNGLDFVTALRDKNKDAIVIIVTGYEDFNYAKRALKLGVFSYLLKPVKEEELFDALAKAKESWRAAKQNKDYFHWAREKALKNRESIVKESIREWIEGRITVLEMNQDCMNLGFDIIGETCALAVLRFARDESKVKPGKEWTDKLLYYAVENITCEILESVEYKYTLKNEEGDMLVVLADGISSSMNTIWGELQEALLKYLPIKVNLEARNVCDSDYIDQVYLELMNRLGEAECLPEIVVKALELIEEKYAEIDFNLQELSGEVGVSPQYLSRLFKNNGIGSFSTYLTTTRIRHAVKLLENTGYKMYEIADKTGYASQHYFSAAFKKVLGVSPAEYRKND